MTHLPKIESTKMRHPGVGMIQDMVAYRLPEFWSQGGNRLPLVTGIWFSGWLPVSTGYQNLGLRVVTGNHWLPEFWSQVGNRLLLVTKFDDLDR